MKTVFLISGLLLVSLFLQAQQELTLNKLRNEQLTKYLEEIEKDVKINVDTIWKNLTAWNKYPSIEQPNRYYLFIYKDSIFGEIPLKVFIPKNYKNNIASPAIIILHGATGHSSFENAYKKDTIDDEDIFFDYFEKQNFVIIKPFADSWNKKFDWVVNRFMGKINPTYNTLNSILIKLKQIINIDDNRVFAFGHSDGADGAFGFQVYQPSNFAGFVVYNSMLTNLFVDNIYLRNTKNRPLYLVHSDLDDLRPIQTWRKQVEILDTLNSPVLYKEYTGYQHFDKHLQKDLPFSGQWIKEIKRNPFQNAIYWETNNAIYNTCDWIKISEIDTSSINAEWHKDLNFMSYDKPNKRFYDDIPYYQYTNKSAAVIANYNNNIFDIQTSRAKAIELYISPVMVNLENPVIIKINGKEVFQGKVIADKDFLINNYKNTFDRSALWITSIKLEVN